MKSISPDADTINVGEKYTVVCEEGYATENKELVCTETDSEPGLEPSTPDCKKVEPAPGPEPVSK